MFAAWTVRKVSSAGSSAGRLTGEQRDTNLGTASSVSGLREGWWLSQRAAFAPINVVDLSQREQLRAVESLLFLIKKQDGHLEARNCVPMAVHSKSSWARRNPRAQWCLLNQSFLQPSSRLRKSGML